MIKRKLFAELKTHLPKKEISFIVGPRQAGKTTLMLLLKEYLEKTFIVQKVTPYFKNVRKEITKSPIFYFYDLGLRNFASGNFAGYNS